MRTIGSLRRLLGQSTVMAAQPPTPPPSPELTPWTQHAYDRLVEAIGPGAEHLSRHEIQTLTWLAGWDVTDDMVNIFRKARQG